MSMKSKTMDRRIIKSKTALKEALLLLMQKKDFNQITITEIVRHADLNRGTFYKHYPFKEELLDEIMDDVIKDLIASYREPYQNVSTFILRDLTASAIKIFHHVEKYANFYVLVVKSNALSGFYKRIGNELKQLALQDLSTYKTEDPDLNRELSASYQSYAILGMIIEWINQGFKYSSTYMAEQLLKIIHLNPVEVKVSHPTDK
ncbi:TetR/AcrR family transcriptional regulator [Shimazuella kribbensis]|uniref:TetR/AcrR family transcriptional regulator n=1 Tax=Shimazuella kribbensis TaxID=139808 RepID=UPI0004238580|nr:TetR/AcrR family transcriptional regulator [Shimazuella kribbensis]